MSPTPVDCDNSWWCLANSWYRSSLWGPNGDHFSRLMILTHSSYPIHSHPIQIVGCGLSMAFHILEHDTSHGSSCFPDLSSLHFSTLHDTTHPHYRNQVVSPQRRPLAAQARPRSNQVGRSSAKTIADIDKASEERHRLICPSGIAICDWTVSRYCAVS